MRSEIHEVPPSQIFGPEIGLSLWVGKRSGKIGGMKLTEKAKLVLRAFADAPDGSIGARAVADLLGMRGGLSRNYAAGGYMGRLAAEGWLWRNHEYYRGARGRDCYAGARYRITQKGLDALKTGKCSSEHKAESLCN